MTSNRPSVSAAVQAPVKANKISGISVNPPFGEFFRSWQLHLQHAELAQAEIVEAHSEQIFLPLNRWKIELSPFSRWLRYLEHRPRYGLFFGSPLLFN